MSPFLTDFLDSQQRSLFSLNGFLWTTFSITAPSSVTWSIRKSCTQLLPLTHFSRPLSTAWPEWSQPLLCPKFLRDFPFPLWMNYNTLTPSLISLPVLPNIISVLNSCWAIYRPLNTGPSCSLACGITKAVDTLACDALCPGSRLLFLKATFPNTSSSIT